MIYYIFKNMANCSEKQILEEINAIYLTTRIELQLKIMKNECRKIRVR
jgi:hypothetical protein